MSREYLDGEFHDLKILAGRGDKISIDTHTYPVVIKIGGLSDPEEKMMYLDRLNGFRSNVGLKPVETARVGCQARTLPITE